MQAVTTAARERGAIFTGESVRAMRAGQKTQTRRVARLVPYDESAGTNLLASGLEPGFVCTGYEPSGWTLYSMGGACWNQRTKRAHCPYGRKGDRIWVRETWSPDHAGCYPHWPVVYKADDTLGEHARTAQECRELAESDRTWRRRHTGIGPGCLCEFRWRSPLLMPRSRSRLLLEVESSRLERLLHLTEADAAAEGVRSRRVTDPDGQWGSYDYHFAGDGHGRARAVDAFADGWNRINGKRAPWESNPWVWVVSFRVLEGAA